MLKKSLPKVQPAEHMRQCGGKQWEQPQWQFPEQVRSSKVNIFHILDNDFVTSSLKVYNFVNFYPFLAIRNNLKDSLDCSSKYALFYI